MDSLKQRISSWEKVLAFSLSAVVLWVAAGVLFSIGFFDTSFFELFKVLVKGDVLAYLAVIFAIQIPVFILFLQSMTTSGFVNRKILPRVTGFKEVLTLFVTLSTLVLLSPRAAFLYFPLIALVAVNFFAIYKAVTVIFEPELYQEAVKSDISRMVRKSFGLLLRKRANDNLYHQRLNEDRLVEFTFFDDPPAGKKKLEIRAKQSGLLEEIDLELFNRVVRKEEFDLEDNLTTNSRGSGRPGFLMALRVQPSWEVRKGAVLATLLLPVIYSGEESLEKQLLKVFRVRPAKSEEITWLDNIEGEFEESLSTSVKNGDLTLLDQTLNIFQVFLEQMDEFITTWVVEGYGLKEAYQELRAFAGDGLSKHVTYGFETLSDLLSKVVKDSQADMYRGLIRFVYRNILSPSQEDNVTTIARFDMVLFSVLNSFIYSNSWNKELSSVQDEILKDILFKLKEHTGILVHQLGELESGGEESSENKIRVTRERFFRRVGDLRSAMLGSIKGNLLPIFQSLLANLAAIEREAGYEKLSQSEYQFVRCNILMLGAYLRQKGMQETEFGIPIMNTIKSWPAGEFLEVLVQCSSKDYADSWRIDTYDMHFDGEVIMREVPDYNKILKSIWVETMLDRADYTESIDYYSSQKPLLKGTTFFTGGQSDEANNEILNLIGGSTEENVVRLRKFAKSLIKVRLDWESDKLIAEELDQSKVDKYREIVNKSYIENSVSRKVFISSGKLTVDQSNGLAGFKGLGLNQVFDKEAFISDWHSGYVIDFHAEQLGKGIAEAQDRTVFNKLLSSSTAFKDIGGFHEVAKQGDRRWFAISNGIGSWAIQRYLEAILVKEDIKGELFIKDLAQSLSIQLIHLADLPKGIYLVDMQVVGQLIQKSAEDIPVSVSVDAYSQNQELLTGMLTTPPDWLQEMGDEEAQKAFLLKKVRLLVNYKFKYQKPRKTDVLFFPIEREY